LSNLPDTPVFFIKDTQVDIRIGFGYDVHCLSEGEELIIGGVRIPFSKGTVAHSNGDVLIHALCDALLGAANLRDIGFHFPDTGTEWKGTDSRIFLKRTVDLLTAQGYMIVNADTTICLQRPKIQDYIPQMQSLLAQTMGIDKNTLSVKAKTSEKLGFIGREEGISAYAVVLIQKIN
jgi:2-C-methyl-D-erythritol 2,4-cyclodiphosphate synthase